MSRLLLVERAIIESCAKNKKSVFEISNETGMNLSMVNSLCSRLSKKGILKRSNGQYSVEEKAESFISANKEGNLKREVEEVTSALVNNYFSVKENRMLRLQKVYVNETEEKILNSLLDQLNTFIQELQISNRANSKNILKSRKVIMWGHAQYEDLIERSIEMAN